MPISHSEYALLTCPACGAGFEADVWSLIDAAERSDLAQALRDGVLNIVTCPKCSTQLPADTALLFHDPASRRVYFAVPPNRDEHAWRGRAQELLYRLVESLPEDERLPYLGDVQVEQEVDGVRRALLRNDRRRGARARPGEGVKGGKGDGVKGQPAENAVDPPVTPSPPHPVTPSAPPTESVIAAARALLAADSDEEFAAMLTASPHLLGDEADVIVRQLADQAYADGDRTMANALHDLRGTLSRARGGPGFSHSSALETATPEQVETLGAQSIESPIANLQSLLSDAAYQALLHVTNPQSLLTAVRDYPTLLEEWANAELESRIEAALDEDNERLARTIEAHREALAELHAQISGRDALLVATQALLAAGSEDAFADAISTYPILLTDAAQAALSELAAEAGAQRDEHLADHARSCQALLQTVRAGLDDH